MKTKTFQEQISFYQERFGYQPPQIKPSISSSTQLAIVIPCHDEPDLLGTLNSLIQCQPTQHSVEVIIVINHGLSAGAQVIEQNKQTAQQAQAWINTLDHSLLTFHLLEAYELPKKYAGVGLARKIGMDEALYRFGSINCNGGIICLDADCRVASNYLVELEKAFMQGIQSASIFFEHRLDASTLLHQGILQYELFLRYYVEALRFAGFPYAYHTIGSSMAVRASTYALSGGMNRRKAGEDFYFLHKVAPLGKYYEINTTSVYPSSRTSHRVPFGTGKAQQKWLDSERQTIAAYDPQTFVDLKEFLMKVPDLFKKNAQELQFIHEKFPETIQAFFTQEEFLKTAQEVNRQTTQLPTFLKRWFHWLDGFKILKFVHFVRDHFYPEVAIKVASHRLLQLTQQKQDELATTDDLLQAYKAIDRKTQGYKVFFES